VSEIALEHLLRNTDVLLLALLLFLMLTLAMRRQDDQFHDMLLR
jgi:hypothetical protein